MEDFVSRPQNAFLRLRSVTREMTAVFQAPIYTIGQPPLERDGCQRVRPILDSEAKSATYVNEDHSCSISFSR
jgi:hypothetical protein